MPLPTPLRPLRHRRFALLWFGAFVSNIGTWMETVGVGILVTETTGRATWTGVVAAAGFVPAAILGPVGGALADRLERRRMLLVTTTIQTGLAVLLTVLAATGTPSPWVVTLIVLAAGCTSAIGFPTYQTLLPDLVPPEDLVGAVALSSAQWNLGRIIGPAVAGIVIGLGGYAWTFGLNALSFGAVFVAIAALSLPPPHHDGSSIVAAIRGGIAYARRDPGLRSVMILVILNSFLAAPFIALVPAMAIKVFGRGAGATSFLTTAQGVGAVVMALSLGALAARFGSRRTLIGMLWGLPPALVVYALAPTLWASGLAIFAVGLLYLGALSSFMSIAQLRAPAQVRGRVLSLITMALGALYPLGSIIQGSLADEIGLRTVTLLSGVVMALALVVLRLARPRLSAALDDPIADYA
ncbi:MAG: MFS transporter [Actinomycetes bacterium]